MTTNHDAGYTTSGGPERASGQYSGGSSAHQGGISGSGGRDSLAGSDRTVASSTSLASIIDALLGKPVGTTVPGKATVPSNYKERYPQYHSYYEIASKLSGVPTDYFDQLAFKESTGKQYASSGVAFGLFEFTKPTAKSVGGKSFVNDIYDLAKQATGVGKLTAQNRSALKSALGREPTYGELYTAHQQGVGSSNRGAIGLLNPKNSNRPATDFVSRAAITQNGGYAGMTAGQFAAHVKGFYNGKSGLGGRTASGAGGSAPVQGVTSPNVDFDNGFWSTILGSNKTLTDTQIGAALESINRGNNSLAGSAGVDDLTTGSIISGGTGSDALRGGSMGDVFGKIASGDLGEALSSFASSVFGGDSGNAVADIGKAVVDPVGTAFDVFGNLLGVGTDSSSDSLGTTIEKYFIRLVVIVLGLIFVAVGLSLFGVSQEPIRVIKKVVS